MIAEKLKKSILQAAIQGKLTEQLAADGDARDLLAAIRAEKTRLIAEKKIKPEKPLPEITEDEIPFDIPENWCWVRLGEILHLQAGKFVAADKIKNTGNYPCYGGNGLRGFVDEFNRAGRFPLIGRQGALCGNINIAEGEFYATEHAVVVTTFCKCNVDWAACFLIALNLNQYSTATAQPGLAVEKINNVAFPLPPLAEQQRIVAAIEALQPELDALAVDERQLRVLQTTFPGKIKAALLKAAIQGKLTEQLLTDGDARDLLAAIRAEKTRLIAEKKIKPEKPLPEITEDEIPFDIPENWCWVRLGEITNIVNGFTPLRSNQNFWKSKDIPWFTISDIRDQGRIITKTQEHISFEAVSSQGRIVPENSVLLCCTASVGEYAFSKISLTTNQQFNALTVRNIYKDWVAPEYLYLFVQTLSAQLQAEAGKTTFPFLSTAKLSKFIIPIGPLKEQQRIIARLDELLPLCSGLA